MPASSRTRAASDGGAVNFTSLVGFGDVQGATIATEYIAQRTGAPGTSGWVSHGITPAQNPLPLFGAFAGLDPSYDGDMSSDLSAGVFRAYRPLTDAPDVAAQLNLYVRRDVRTPGAGVYQLISDPGFDVPATFTPVRPMLAGASSDFSHVIFESTLNLDASASGDQAKLYEWADGTLRLAGILPDGTAADSSQAGQGAVNPLPLPTPRMISADGSRIFFRAPVDTGNVYMRVDGTTTVQLNASEKTSPEPPQGATLWTASADGTRIFFDTNEGLVDDDDDGGASDYYMYDVNAPARHHLTLVTADGEPSSNDSTLGVVGASDDGRYLYFMVAGQLVAGENPRVFGLYVWHDGNVRLIGELANPADTGLSALNATWLLVDVASVARVSADGSHVLFGVTDDSGFRGRGGFAGFDHGTACGGSGCLEFYVYDAPTGQLRCASCDPAGGTPTGRATNNIKLDAYASDASPTSYVSHALSSDGRWTFFNSPDALVPEDVNGRFDAYEYDFQTGRVQLLSSGRSSDGSYFMDASASGRDVFFVTRERLVGWDVDASYDLYDARVGGGLPEPLPTPPACTGSACHGAPAAPPAPDSAGSSSLHGKGDLGGRLSRHRVKHRRCAHGKRRVVRRGRVRCVRKKARRGRRAARVSGMGGGQR